ncbi:MAG: hypothetical protein QMD17_09280 [Rhodocyclaceae bacterium]|nr:hypothetical protein [Rhodocyclaceae bacterium]
MTIPLRVSRHLVIALVVVHLLAIVAILPLMLTWPLRLAMIGTLLVSLGYFLGRQYRPVVIGLQLGAEGEIEIATTSGAGGRLGDPPEAKVGAGGTATILPQTAVLPNLVVLHLLMHGRLLTVPVLPDTTGMTAFRQLSIWLKWRARLG